jgi:hypothetical protein
MPVVMNWHFELKDTQILIPGIFAYCAYIACNPQNVVGRLWGHQTHNSRDIIFPKRCNCRDTIATITQTLFAKLIGNLGKPNSADTVCQI